jgi:hypothetical protein
VRAIPNDKSEAEVWEILISALASDADHRNLFKRAGTNALQESTKFRVNFPASREVALPVKK